MSRKRGQKAPAESKGRSHSRPPASSGRPHALLAGSLLVGLVLLLYYPSLDGPFVFDDPNAISQSSLIQSLRPLDKFLRLSTRPVTDFSLAVNYAIGGLHPRAFHATNILLHAVNVLLAYLLALRTLSLAGGRSSKDGNGPVAWAAAALFAAHPLATETVAYMSSRSEVLVATFFLLTLLLYAIATSTRNRRVRTASSVALPVCTALALASKEIAVTIPAIVALYDWCFLARGDWRRTRGRWRLIGLTILPLAAGGLLLLHRAYSSGFGAYAQTAGFGFDRFGAWQYFITELGVIVHYLRLAIWPVGLTFDYDWPLARSFWTAQVLLPFALLSSLLFVAVRQVRLRPSLTFAIVGMLLMLAPTSSVLPIADLAVERRMYLPLVGLSLLAANSLWPWTARGRERRAAAPDRTRLYGALLLVPLVPFCYLTHQRAALWADGVALHQDGVAKAPGNPRVRLNLGVTYLNLNRLDDARSELTKAKQLYDEGLSVHAFRRIGAFIEYNLGAVLFMQGEPGLAAHHLELSLEGGGEYLALRPMAMFILGRIAEAEQNWSLAATRYEEALRYQPRNAAWCVDLARAQRKSGNRNGAIASARRALHLQPGHEAARRLLDEMAGRRPRSKLGPPE